jgi:ribosomal protein S18 acetylase RimI-like enzyme
MRWSHHDQFRNFFRIRNKKALRSAVEKFHDQKLPFACWIGSDNDYPECKKDLEEMGFVCDEHESGMFAEIEKLSREKKCGELQISLVNNSKRLNNFIQIYRELISQDANAIEEFYGRASEHILNPESSLKLFVGYFRDQPAATSALFMDKNTTGVWDVVTIPQFRRRGIGTDMTLHALFYAFDNFGRRIGVLSESEDGEPVYRKIGFQKLKDFYVINVNTQQLGEMI